MSPGRGEFWCNKQNDEDKNEEGAETLKEGLGLEVCRVMSWSDGWKSGVWQVACGGSLPLTSNPPLFSRWVNQAHLSWSWQDRTYCKDFAIYTFKNISVTAISNIQSAHIMYVTVIQMQTTANRACSTQLPSLHLVIFYSEGLWIMGGKVKKIMLSHKYRIKLSHSEAWSIRMPHTGPRVIIHSVCQ